MMGARYATLLLGVLALAMPAVAPAQTVVAEAAVHSLSIGDGSLTQVVLPLAASWRAGGVRFDANTAIARAVYERRDVRSELTGLTDVTVRVMIPVLEDRGRLIIAANVPTGSETLAEDELPVAGILTTDLLGMPVRSFGSGAGVTAGMALTRPVGDWVAGGIAVYRVGGGYEPVAGSPAAPAAEFRPGSEFRIRLGLERPRVGGVTWRLGGSWSRFGADRADDRSVFARGDRLLGEAVAELPFLRGSAHFFAWTLYRSASEILVAPTPETAPASTLLGLGASAVQPLGPALSIRPRAELTVQGGEPGFGGGSGWVARVGSGASYRTGAVRLEPAVLLQVGGFEDDGVFGVVLRGGVLWQR